MPGPQLVLARDIGQVRDVLSRSGDEVDSTAIYPSVSAAVEALRTAPPSSDRLARCHHFRVIREPPAFLASEQDAARRVPAPTTARSATLDIGPVELLVLTFTSDTVGPEVREALADVVAGGDVTILDLVFVAKDDEGNLRVVEVEEQDDRFGLSDLDSKDTKLLNDEDIALVAEALDEGTSAAFLVYEHTWARKIAAAIAAAGGEVALHVRVPRDDVEAALAAATV